MNSDIVVYVLKLPVYTRPKFSHFSDDFLLAHVSTLIRRCSAWILKFSLMCISTTLHVPIMCILCACNVCCFDLIQRISASLYLFSFSALTFLQKTFPQANISTAVTDPVINKGIGFLNYMGAWQGRGMLKMFFFFHKGKDKQKRLLNRTLLV